MAADLRHRILSEVCREVHLREEKVPFTEIKALSRNTPPPRDAVHALIGNGCGVIPEYKRQNSRADDASWPIGEAAALAEEFQANGAQLIACQSSSHRHGGSLDDLLAVSRATDVPVICRDLICDPYQVHEARVFGADVVPLQLALLDQDRLVSLLDRIESLGMTALAEVRNPVEAERALHAGAEVIGVNTRDLFSSVVRPECFAEVASGLPESVVRIGLSGVRHPGELLRFAANGADAVIVGEIVMRSDDRGAMVRSLVAAGQHPACPSRKADIGA